MSEKTRHFSGLPATVDLVRPDHPPSHKHVKTLIIGLCLGALGAGCFVLRTIIPTLVAPGSSVQLADQLCPQAKPMTPVQHSMMWKALVGRSTSDKLRERAVEWLSGAVRIRTESYDYMEPVGVDPCWDVFEEFHNYLLRAFPLVHSTLVLTKVNTSQGSATFFPWVMGAAMVTKPHGSWGHTMSYNGYKSP